MNYDEFFNYQISNTSPLDFATRLNNEFLSSCPKELVSKNRKLELDSGIVKPCEADPSYHFCITGFAFYGKSRAGEDKKDEGMQRPTSKKDLRVIPPDLSDRSLVDIEIRIIDENSIQVICTWNNNHIRLIEFLKNLKEQIRRNYNLVALSKIAWSDLSYSSDLADVDFALFEFIFRDSPETFLDWCHTELAVIYPGVFYYDDGFYGPGIVARPSAEIVPPDKNESVWRYVIYAGNQYEDGTLSISNFIAAYIEARPIENNQCLVTCLYDPTISPGMKEWLARLEERAKAINTSTLMAEEGEKAPSDKPEPWMCIPDHFWDRKAVEMWCKGHSNQEIANKVNVESRTVTNKISILRQKYPDAGIPYHKERWKLMIRRDKP
jgi:hypothetical protein